MGVAGVLTTLAPSGDATARIWRGWSAQGLGMRDDSRLSRPPRPSGMACAPPRRGAEGKLGGEGQGTHPPPTRSPISRSERLNTCAPPDEKRERSLCRGQSLALSAHAGVGEQLHAAAGRADGPVLQRGRAPRTTGSVLHLGEGRRRGWGLLRNQALLGGYLLSRLCSRPHADWGPLGL